MNQTTESVVSGDSVKTVKLVDKSRRAFSVSIESTKAFEIAIRKPRTKAKHIVTKIRAYFYGLFLLLVKHHGKPPTGHDLTGYFVFMAAIVGLDVMVLMNFTYHIFLLPTNLFWSTLNLLLLFVPFSSNIESNLRHRICRCRISYHAEDRWQSERHNDNVEYPTYHVLCLSIKRRSLIFALACGHDFHQSGYFWNFSKSVAEFDKPTLREESGKAENYFIPPSHESGKT